MLVDLSALNAGVGKATRRSYAGLAGGNPYRALSPVSCAGGNLGGAYLGLATESDRRGVRRQRTT